MTRNLPIIPTIIVVLAALIMVGLGFWQLGRADEKEAMLARYATAGDLPESVVYPLTPEQTEQDLYRRSSITCERVLDRRATAGTSEAGVKGWAQIARCALKGGGETEVALGWTRAPDGPQWTGGTVTGIIAPGPKLIADPPRAGLIALSPPDPADLPNNHMAYAGQWFFFAVTALVIYFLALRRRRRDQDADELDRDDDED